MSVYIQQGIDQPFWGSGLYGSVVYGSAWPANPPSQAVGWPAFFQAISDYLISTNTFGPGLAFFAIDPDSFTQWPQTTSPFGLVVPLDIPTEDDDIGGGRFCKLWRVAIDIHIVAGNSYDTAYQDTQVVTSPSLAFGPYALVHLLNDKMNQAYIKTADGNFATVEFPRSTRIGKLYRFKQTNNYVSIPVTFEMVVEESMPSTWLPGAMPPSSEDF
jgi:hypothetical protein